MDLATITHNLVLTNLLSKISVFISYELFTTAVPSQYRDFASNTQSVTLFVIHKNTVLIFYCRDGLQLLFSLILRH